MADSTEQHPGAPMRPLALVCAVVLLGIIGVGVLLFAGTPQAMLLDRTGLSESVVPIVPAVEHISGGTESPLNWSEPSLEVQKKISAIRDELAQPFDHPWAGEYCYGEGLGTNVRLLAAPASGFAFTLDGCLGLYDENYGEIQLDHDRIALHCNRPNNRREYRGIAEEFVVVRWGQRRYLIPPEQMIAFANDVNDGSEPRGSRYGDHFLAEPDWDIPVTGRPDLPGEFVSAYSAPPIEGQIVKVISKSEVPSGKSHRVEFRVRMNIGASQGAYLGMDLACTDPEDVFLLARLVEVAGDSSIATIFPADSEDPEPEVGWTFVRDKLKNRL